MIKLYFKYISGHCFVFAFFGSLIVMIASIISFCFHPFSCASFPFSVFSLSVVPRVLLLICFVVFRCWSWVSNPPFAVSRDNIGAIFPVPYCIIIRCGHVAQSCIFYALKNVFVLMYSFEYFLHGCNGPEAAFQLSLG